MATPRRMSSWHKIWTATQVARLSLNSTLTWCLDVPDWQKRKKRWAFRGTEKHRSVSQLYKTLKRFLFSEHPYHRNKL